MDQRTGNSLDLIGRRSFLQVGTSLITMSSLPLNVGSSVKALAHSVQEAMPLSPAKLLLDHLLLGTAELEEGIDWVEKQTGVKAARGGSHPGVGTHNALLSLGDRQYLEIIAPDPSQKPAGVLVSLLKEFSVPKPFTWAASTRNIELLANTLRGAGLTIEGPEPGSRMRPDGRRLQWKTIRLSGQRYGLIPFFIEWASDAVHPSVDSPSGCQLTGLKLYHPEPDVTGQTLRKFGIAAEIQSSLEPAISIRLNCPKGTVIFD